MTPRDYQLDCIIKTEHGFDEFDKLLGVLPTGGGKTIVFSHLAKRRWDAHQERTLILAHRDELIWQAAEKLHQATGIEASVEKAEYEGSLTAPVVVASIQTMQRRYQRWPKDHFGLVVCDEAHRVLSTQWQEVLAYFESQVLGVTATPYRGDKKNLGRFFQFTAFEYGLYNRGSIPGLIDMNPRWLSPITVKSIPLKIDLSQVGTSMDSDSGCNDFNKEEVANVLEPYLDEIAVAIREHCAFRRMLCFLPLRSTSRKFVGACIKAGLSARHVDGESDDRSEILKQFGAFEFDLLSNAMLLTEGYDDPGIDGVCVLRPTKSQNLYCQMIGRGTRLAPSKKDVMLFDPLWMHEKHDVCRPSCLIAETDIEAKIIDKIIQEKSAALPAELAAELPLIDLQSVFSDAAKQREEALRKKLEENRRKKSKTISAEEFALNHGEFRVADYEPTMEWESASVSEKQAKLLKRAKIDLSTVRGRGHASQLLNIHFKNLKPRLAAPKAVALMRRMPGLCAAIGIADLDNATAAQAGRFFAELKRRKEQPELA